MNFFKLIFLLSYMTIYFNSCGAAKDIADGGSDDNTGKVLNGIEGVWIGDLKDERPGAHTVIIPVTLTLNADSTFEMKSNNNELAVVKGTYQKYSNTVVFAASQSNISSFSLAGEIQDYNFSLIGETLELFNNSSLIRLKFYESVQGSQNNNTENNDKFTGNWTGSDSKSRFWKITIFDNNSFSAQVTGNTGSALTFGGSYTSKDEGLIMTADYANAENITGTSLTMNKTNSGAANIVVSDKGGKIISQFSVNRF